MTTNYRYYCRDVCIAYVIRYFKLKDDIYKQNILYFQTNA